MRINEGFWGLGRYHHTDPAGFFSSASAPRIVSRWGLALARAGKEATSWLGSSGAPLVQAADRVRLKSQSLGGYADWGRLVSVVACA